MAMTGRCYCGALKYEVSAPPIFSGQCHCRECQYFSGGGPNYLMGVPAGALSYTEGEPKGFARDDIEQAATREFCATCGTHMLTRTPRNPAIVILKVGTLDDPSQYPGPQIAIQTDDMQPYHLIAEGVARFPRFPG